MPQSTSLKPTTSSMPGNFSFIETPREVIDERQEVLASLCSNPPRLAPKYFYDSEGSALFEAITRTEEYYPTRAEAQIFDRYLDDIAGALGEGDVIIEPGSGNCEKAVPLIRAAKPQAYVPIDIAGEFLFDAARSLAEEYPEIDITAIAADFTQSWDFADRIPEGRRFVFYPGSTLGNFEPAAQKAFLTTLASVVGHSGGLLLGLDLHKDSATLEAAYDDAAGVTAAFNRNMLAVVNAHTGANFVPENWEHRAHYNKDQKRVEMTLTSTTDQVIRIGEASLRFNRGRQICTEHCYKFTLEGIAALAESAGLQLKHSWLDDESRFCVVLLAH